MRATLIHRERTEAVVQRFRLPWPVLRLGLSGSFERGSTQALDGHPPGPLVSRRDQVAFYPARTTIVNEVVASSRMSYLTVEIDEAIVADVETAAPGVPRVDAGTPLSLALLHGLRGAIEHPGTVGTLLAETMALTLMLEVARPVPVAGPGIGRPQLAPRQLARVTDHMRDRLADDLSLGELAAMAGLSRSQFCRAFRGSTGTTPHRWLTEARIQRAKELMSGTDLPLASIAHATGFADQSHFTTVFRRWAGLPPHAWRRRED
ncbi:helix-turn-helix domain-containing protein [Methylobacterium sp. JK268]